jgi:hypothetical protein
MDMVGMDIEARGVIGAGDLVFGHGLLQDYSGLHGVITHGDQVLAGAGGIPCIMIVHIS